MRVSLMHRPDGNRFFEVGRIADRNRHVSLNVVVLALEDSVTLVACREAHHHALTPQPPQFLAQGGVPAPEHARIEIAAEAQVHALDRQRARLLVYPRHQIDGLDNPAVLPFAVVIEHLESIEAAARCHSGHDGAVTKFEPPRDDASDVCAVTVAV